MRFYSQHEEQQAISPIYDDGVFDDVSASVCLRF